MLIGRRHFTFDGAVTSIVVAAAAAGSTIADVSIVVGDHITIVSRRRCNSNDGCFPSLSTHLVMLQLIMMLMYTVVFILLVVPIVVSGIDDAGPSTPIHHYLLLILHHNPFPCFLLNLHVHATIDDAIVIDPLHYFVHVAPVIDDVIVIVLSQTIRLIRPTFLYRVNGVAYSEQLGVGA